MSKPGLAKSSSPLKSALKSDSNSSPQRRVNFSDAVTKVSPPPEEVRASPAPQVDIGLDVEEAKAATRDAAKLIALSAALVATAAITGGALMGAVTNNDPLAVNAGRVVGAATAVGLLVTTANKFLGTGK